jgi:hypothetical protein
MGKAFVRFAVIVVLAQVISYFLAGLLARFVLGASQFYPPAPTALSYLKDPQDASVEALIWPAQVVRGLLFAMVLFPFRKQFLEWGIWRGGLALGSLIFIVGFVAASGGMIEHFVFFKPADYPVPFALITFVEVLVQTAILGPAIVRFDKPAVATGTVKSGVTPA